MTPKRTHSPTPSTPKKSRSFPSSSSAASPRATWTPEEDAIVMRLRATVPATSFAQIAIALGGTRTAKAVTNRYERTLKYEDLSDEGLNPDEKKALMQALEDLESGREKWWFVAARYAELRKPKAAGMRELGKMGAKKWCGIIRGEEK
ncbi:hypothetical protein K440DRAFT_661692 [Wilcoxina mikolae CBS 423.85]|nr:hypothetical protein K440DRAFT_661692 [Wilcoxina mikolae CBS 423.85]